MQLKNKLNKIKNYLVNFLNKMALKIKISFKY